MIDVRKEIDTRIKCYDLTTNEFSFIYNMDCCCHWIINNIIISKNWFFDKKCFSYQIANTPNDFIKQKQCRYDWYDNCYVSYFVYRNRYMFMDMYDRIISKDTLYEKCKEFTNEKRLQLEREQKKNRISFLNKQREEKDKRREFKDNIIDKSKYFHYYRRIKTTQEKRFAADPEIKQFVRDSRNVRNLPNAWDDICIFIEYN